MIKPVLLWTDALLLLLVIVVVVFIAYARSRPHIRAPWKRVFTGRIAAAAGVLLLAYVLLGLLDSLHFRLPLEGGSAGEMHYAGEVLSVLDVLAGPVRTHIEKTYSAPFATHLFSMETMESADGRQVRGYPRLAWGGRHLRNPERERAGDILLRSGRAFVWALCATALLFLLTALLLSRREPAGINGMLMAMLFSRTAAPLSWVRCSSCCCLSCWPSIWHRPIMCWEPTRSGRMFSTCL